MSDQLDESVLEAYGIEANGIESAGGTAGKAWHVNSTRGHYFVRRRGVRTSGSQRVRYDHGLRQHLGDQDFPAFPPISNRIGDRFLIHEDLTYEVYPWVEGRPYALDLSDKARGPAARILARLHQISASYSAPCEPVVSQFSAFPVEFEPRPRMDDPVAFLEVIDWVLDAYGTPRNQAAIRKARDRVRWLSEVYDSDYRDLTWGVIHGDFNCSNLLFHADGEVAGVFDYDWARREVRLRDIAELIFFFGAQRSASCNYHDIWFLTECPTLDINSIKDVLRCYHLKSPLMPAEQRALPWAILARWVSCRTEGLIKVPEDRRVEFLLQDFDRPFQWLDPLRSAFEDVFAGR